MCVDFGGTKTPGFELVRMVGGDEIEDGKVTLVGPDIDTIQPGGGLGRLVWLPKALKDELRPSWRKRPGTLGWARISLIR